MSSSLQKQLYYKEMAEKYSRLNDFQLFYGKKLVDTLDIALGDKVLDVGCGTGEITAYIADTVKEDGLCVGFDPDKYRIEVAMEKHLPARTNIIFFHGDSSSKFPHANEEFYDYVFCSSVLQWMSEHEKITFMKTVYSSLRPGGKLGVISSDANLKIVKCTQELVADSDIKSSRCPFKQITKLNAEEMLCKNGFLILSDKYFDYSYLFKTSDLYLSWFCASTYLDKQKFLPEKVENFIQHFQNEDGTIPFEVTMYEILAIKPYRS
ncbi:ubiquinone/menaquinone biosynthesis C-methyltransferase UbiE-like [Xenia sp. Carnegie-2017]|uniref:ubiquinone/menaquinone biosynthesis C-methyltransferase UbiE-like n=1 Tax=Xenia sp. Carnegie-2017 TaxID=2897299 RepID=UPI001F049C07|nr:ubiquinone/menaquinone biosynthesis C-methyltransferase UbiE-like [Xenia sp. Carnegie-2017]